MIKQNSFTTIALCMGLLSLITCVDSVRACGTYPTARMYIFRRNQSVLQNNYYFRAIWERIDFSATRYNWTNNDKYSFDEDQYLAYDIQLPYYCEGIKQWDFDMGDGHTHSESYSIPPLDVFTAYDSNGDMYEYSPNDGCYEYIYPQTGQYNCRITVTDDDDYEGLGLDKADQKSYIMVIYDIDLVLESEIVQYNNDDDNGDGDMDCYDYGQIEENDLVRIDLSVSTPRLTQDRVMLTWYCKNRFKLWSSPDKQQQIEPDNSDAIIAYKTFPADQLPSSLYIEGLYPGNWGTVQLDYVAFDGQNEEVLQNGGQSRTFDIVEIDIDIDGVQDCDYEVPEVTQETIPGGYVAKGELKKLTLKRPEPSTLFQSTDELALYCISGRQKIRLWDGPDPQTANELVLPVSFQYSEINTTKDIWLEGIEVSDTERDITLAWSCTINNQDFEDRINLSVTGISVKWETYPDDVIVPPPGIDHGQNEPIGTWGEGRRIFPGKLHWEDTSGEAAMRRKVRVVATLIPPVDNRTVYFRPWDIDDPCSAPIDLNDGDPSSAVGGDNVGGIGTLSSTSAQTNAAGIAKTTFIVTMKPGDNFKIAASLDGSLLYGAPPQVMTQAQADGRQPLPSGVFMSARPLTVWRKVWLEQDSMDSVAMTGTQANLITGTDASYTGYTHPYTDVILGQELLNDWAEENHFLMGYYKPATGAAALTHSNTLVRAKVLEDLTSASSEYEFWDDDLDSSRNLKIADLPRYPRMGSMSNEYRKARIQVNYLPSEFTTVVSFQRCMYAFAFGLGAGDWNDHYGCPSSPGFFTVLVVTGYQPDPVEDCDGEVDAALGYANVGPRECMIFLETIESEVYETPEITIAHEVGHAIADLPDMPEHASTNCMMDGDAVICDECIRKLRVNGGW